MGNNFSQLCTDDESDDDADDKEDAEDEEQPQVGIGVFLAEPLDASACPLAALHTLFEHCAWERTVGNRRLRLYVFLVNRV